MRKFKANSPDPIISINHYSGGEIARFDEFEVEITLTRNGQSYLL